MPDPIVKTVTVPLDPDRAFRLFTEELADWWPLDTHSQSAEDSETARSVDVPDKVGEEVLETRPDGRTEPWGRVTEWTPGRAFGMTWHPGRPEHDASHVRVSFDVVADGTRVTVIHDSWPALDAVATLHACATVPAWQSHLKRYATACRALLILA